MILIGDDEYKTEVTLPAFAKSELEPLGFEVQIIHADSQDKNNFPGMAEACRRPTWCSSASAAALPPKDQLDALRQHVAAANPSSASARPAMPGVCVMLSRMRLQRHKDEVCGRVRPGSVWRPLPNHYGAGRRRIAAPEGAVGHATVAVSMRRTRWPRFALQSQTPDPARRHRC